MPSFDSYVGIDYSGAQSPTSRLPGLRVFVADRVAEPVEVRPTGVPRKHWTRRGVAEWLAGLLSGSKVALAGIDHGFSLPLRYFEKYGIAHDWPLFLPARRVDRRRAAQAVRP